MITYHFLLVLAYTYSALLYRLSHLKTTCM